MIIIILVLHPIQDIFTFNKIVPQFTDLNILQQHFKNSEC